MKTSIVTAVFLLLSFGHEVAAGAEKKMPAVPPVGVQGLEVLTPTGEYAICSMELTHKQKPPLKGTANTTLMGGMRNDRWTISDGIGVREPGGVLISANGRLTGTVRRVDFGGELTIDLPLNNGEFSGEGTLAGETIPIKGRIIPEAELARQNALPRELSWPSFLGDINGGLAVKATATPTLDDASQAVVRWRCEENDIGRGMGNINRFMIQWGSAIQRRAAGGSSSPLLKDGRIYLRYYVPNPNGPSDPNTAIPEYRITPAKAAEEMLAQAKAAGWIADKLPEYALEKTYPDADEVILCTDAATGKTLWKSILRGRGRNAQHHKAGIFNHTPVIANGKLFTLTNRGLLYALDAETGKGLWEIDAAFHHSVALTAAGNVLLTTADNGWGAYDQASGKLLWKTPGPRSVAALLLWSHDGKDFLLGCVGGTHDELSCLEASTGKEVWKLPVIVATHGRGFGPGGITVTGDTMSVNTLDAQLGRGDKIKASAMALQAYALSVDKTPNLLWSVRGRATSAKTLLNNAKAAPAAKDEKEEADDGERGVIHLECIRLWFWEDLCSQRICVRWI